MPQFVLASLNDNTKENLQKTPEPWCEFLGSDGHWVRTESYKTQDSCRQADKRDEHGNAYTWQHEEPQDSTDGTCVVNKTENGFSRQYQTTKLGCENHDRHGNESYHWESDNYPMVYIDYNHTGYGYILMEDIPSLCKGPETLMRLCHLIKSYHIPEGWVVEFYEEDNYQGQYYRRSFTEEHDENNFIEGVTINSIKMYSTKAPPIEPVEHKITSLRQVYFGERNPSYECGHEGRLLTASDIESIGGNKEICKSVTSPWAIWKIKGSDDTKWSFMGSGYQCKMKPGVNDWEVPLCVAKSNPHETEAYLFAEPDFANTAKWRGRPVLGKINDEKSNTQVKSFLLGTELVLEGYSEVGFKGISKEYLNSNQNVEPPILSYKIRQRSLIYPEPRK